VPKQPPVKKAAHKSAPARGAAEPGGVARRGRESGDALNAYMREIARFCPLSSEVERELGQRIRAGEREALNELVEANLRFVVSYAKRYRGLGLSFADLIHEGNLGLIEAARRFDPGRNVRFISYAVWWVRQAILLALSSQGRALRLPQKVAGQLGRVHDVRESLTSALDREPTIAEVARATDLTEREVEDIDRLAASEVSLSTSLREDGDLELEDTLEQETIPSVEHELMREALQERMQALVGQLDEKEQRVISLRYGLNGDEPRTLQEIGDMLGVTRERVRQIESRAKEKLRRTQQAQALRGCLN
jgi:RNA polymerase primary sigma factor